MTQEDIEEAADKYTDELFKKENDFYVRDCLGIIAPDAFVAGANWRINSIWHDISETPDIDKEILIMGDDGDCLILYWDKSNEKIFRSNFIKWAYMEDLLPSKEE